MVTEDIFSSVDYWENRYQKGGNSGAGSYGDFSIFKSKFINDFVSKNNIGSVIEFGCGDGNQLSLAKYNKYIGIDVSNTIVNSCRLKFSQDFSKKFMTYNEYNLESADLSLSLDVIFHLVEQNIFEEYMNRLFASSRRYVIIYSSNTNDSISPKVPHIKHRRFSDWIDLHEPGWRLLQYLPNSFPYKSDGTGTFADFYVYGRHTLISRIWKWMRVNLT